MEKIYNNLSIENLTRTDWFKKFNVHQKYEISEGLKDNLDVSVYANSEYSWKKMKNIREEILKEKENKENGKNL